MIVSQRTSNGKTTTEQHFYLSSLPPNAARLNQAVRAHWQIENSLVVFDDDQMRARTEHAAHNVAVLRHFAINLIRLAPVTRKVGIKVKRLIAATSDTCRAQLLGWD